MKARLGPRGKAVVFILYLKAIETIHDEQDPNLFVYWANRSDHLLLLKSPMHKYVT